MAQPPHTRSWALFALLALTACGGGGGGKQGPSNQPDASASTLAVEPAFGAPADGSEPVAVTVTVRTKSGKPVSGRTVVISATGQGNTITQAAAETDADGIAIATLTTTAAETKTIGAVVDPGAKEVALDATGQARFVWPEPATYYVRQSGSDANAGTSPAQAWQTLAHAALQVAAGDTVYVGAGTYNESVTLATSGADGQPIAFVADTTGARTGDAGAVVVDAGGAAFALRVDGADFVLLDGFEVTGARPGAASGGGVWIGDAATQAVALRNLRAYGNDRGLALENADIVLVQDCRVSANDGTPGTGILLEDCLDVDVSNNLVYGNSGAGISLESTSEDIDLVFNTLYLNGGDQVSVSGTGSDVILLNNVLSEGLADGIDVSGGFSVLEQANLVFAHVGLNYNGLGPDPTDIQLDPLFLDPAGPDLVLGGANADDDDFRFDVVAPSPTLDAGNGPAIAFLLSDGVTTADLTTRPDARLDGTAPDLPRVNLGFHYPASVGSLDGLGGGDARIAYGRGDERQFVVRGWDPAGDVSAEALSPSTNSRIQWVVNQVSPLENGEELYGVLANAGIFTELEFLLWTGSEWSSLETSLAITPAHADKRGFDAAFESTTGDVLVVWSNGDETPLYSMRSGGAWSPPSPVFATAPGSDTVLWLELVSQPASDEVALVWLDEAEGLYAMIWDGESWDEAGSLVQLDNQISTTDALPFSAAYEATSNELLVLWGPTTSTEELGFATHTTADGWTLDTIASAPVAAEVVRLAADPSSDRIVAGLSGGASASDVGAMMWDGSSWLDVLELDATAAADDHDLAVAWVGTTGKAVLAYQDDDAGTAALDWASWDLATGWTLEADFALPGLGEQVAFELRGSSGSSKVVALVADDAGALWAATYDGTSWSAAAGGAALETDLSLAPGSSQPFDLRVGNAQDQDGDN